MLRDGTKIFLPEYEAALQPLLPGRDFAVTEQNGAPVLVIFGEESERETLTRALEGHMRTLPRGQQLKTIRFVNSPLPRTATGKIKRWSIQQKEETT